MSSPALPLASNRVRQLRHALLRWYDQHRRDLPWRRDRNPYSVWVSEIMLQQTRVAAVIDHYARFMTRFPTVHALAGARESSVLAAWSGLGYYHRARRMHRAAKLLVREHGGKFPNTAKGLYDLPGIGRYTSAAIASIAFGETVAVVDGNVERVLHRLMGDDSGSSANWSRAEALLDRTRPGDFNQAMMELGAIVCTPRSPQCPVCPLHGFCSSRGAGPDRKPVKRKRGRLCYLFSEWGGKVLLMQRSANQSLMAGMWELPPLLLRDVTGATPLLRLRHAITDTDYRVEVFSIPHLDRSRSANARWLTPQQWTRLPLTGLTRKILRRVSAESAQRGSVSN